MHINNNHIALREHLSAHPDAILERVAAEYNLTLLDVLRCFPEGFVIEREGDGFIAALQAIANWGDVTTIIHTSDIIMEFDGQLPPGSLGHGFYNLSGKGGLSGHLRPHRCARIAFIERPFMGLTTAGIIFINPEGGCMFKVFTKRLASNELNPFQIKALRELSERLA